MLISNLTPVVRPALLAGLSALAVHFIMAVTVSASQSLNLGFDDPVFTGSDSLAAPWLTRATDSGANTIRLQITWASIAPTKPTHASDPADRAYRFSTLDAFVRRTAGAGLTPLIAFQQAPAWAEGPHAPRFAPVGTWRPNPAAYAAFARALGRRYSGTYRDPMNAAAVLPRVIYWEAWNEPNLSTYLTPQWTRAGRGFRLTSPEVYRSLLNGFYTGVKASEPHAVVVSASTAPFGDAPGGQRVPPAEFLRQLLCLRGGDLTPVRCQHPAHFDVLAHHPYAVAGPFVHALNPDDVSIADLLKLERPLRRAERTGRVLPVGHKPIWVTEVSYDSDPPDPQGVPIRTHAGWVEETLFELWRERVSTVIWFLIRDAPPVPDYASTYQSGMYFLDGTPKLSQQAFRFPLVAEGAGSGREVLWTRVPISGRLEVQRRVAGRWHAVFSASVIAHSVFERVIRAAPGTRWRARIAGQNSLVWRP